MAFLAQLLDWSAKQGRILTGGGKAETLYSAENGFPFEREELPHHHLTLDSTHEMFAFWKKERRTSALICGAWERPLFMGGWEHSTAEHELVFNLQTPSIFIDIRIPRGRPLIQGSAFSDLTVDELRCLARQHAFAGYSLFGSEPEANCICTRHHAIDWNFVGMPRSRPNKWRVECDDLEPTRQWKEWSFARDKHGQHYYMERWSRLAGDADGRGPYLALRATRGSGRDGFLVMVGDHFSYIFSRSLPAGEPSKGSHRTCAELVDAALASGDRATAEAYLRLEAGHGLVGDGAGSGWIIDKSLQPWVEGTQLFAPGDWEVPGVDSSSLQKVAAVPSRIAWKDQQWDVIECSLKTAEELAFTLSALPKRRTQDFHSRL